MRFDRANMLRVLVSVALVLGVAGNAEARKRNKKSAQEDPYAEYVWPAPPDEPRIKLQAVVSGRTDVSSSSGFRKWLLKSSPQLIYDKLKKPFAVEFDNEDRVLVTDSATGALLRFDFSAGRMDVFGTRGAVHLVSPKGLDVAPDGTIYVADIGINKVLAFNGEGKIVAAYGRQGELTNPTDVVLSADGATLFVADSQAHRIVTFDREGGERLSSFGRRGREEGEFNFPTSLAVSPEGQLFVVDQMNSRVQTFDADGEYVDEFGQLGVGFANFVRPKDVAVDDLGLIYVTDNAYNNVQLFDTDHSLLTFVGEAGEGPGRFLGASGVAVRGDLFAVVDQLGHRLQLFRFIVPRDR